MEFVFCLLQHFFTTSQTVLSIVLECCKKNNKSIENFFSFIWEWLSKIKVIDLLENLVFLALFFCILTLVFWLFRIISDKFPPYDKKTKERNSSCNELAKEITKLIKDDTEFLLKKCGNQKDIEYTNISKTVILNDLHQMGIAIDIFNKATESFITKKEKIELNFLYDTLLMYGQGICQLKDLCILTIITKIGSLEEHYEELSDCYKSLTQLYTQFAIFNEVDKIIIKDKTFNVHDISQLKENLIQEIKKTNNPNITDKFTHAKNNIIAVLKTIK